MNGQAPARVGKLARFTSQRTNIGEQALRITQVKNGYILMRGTNTLVSYTFDELVKHLADVFERLPI